MSANIGKMLLLAGILLLVGTSPLHLAFWVEAVGFALVFSGLVLLRPNIQDRYDQAGKWIYWLLMLALLSFVYFSWF